MRTFTDNAGRTWTIAITVDAIRRVRGRLEIDLLEFVEGNLIAKLIRDPVLLCDVIYVVCKPQADEQGVSDTDFGRAMAGDAIDYATKALLEELVDFSPSPRDRANLKRILETTFAAMETVRDEVDARIATLDVTAIVARTLASASDSSGAAPDSSA